MGKCKPDMGSCKICNHSFFSLSIIRYSTKYDKNPELFPTHMGCYDKARQKAGSPYAEA